MRRVIELGADFAAQSAFADHRTLGTRTQHQLQGVNQNGLARAGFTREHAEPLVQIQFEFAHDDEIAQADTFETHATPSFQ